MLRFGVAMPADEDDGPELPFGDPRLLVRH